MYTLLLVDDEEATLLGLSAIPWNKLNVSTVLLASSVDEALTQLESNCIHVLITDIRMPGKSGIDLLVEMERRHYATKGLLLSGYADFEYAKQAILLHAVDYLLKPCSDEEIMKAVERAIDFVIAEEREKTEKRNIVSQFTNKPLLIGEFLLQKWIADKPSQTSIKQQIKEYQLPFYLDSACVWMGVYNDNLKDAATVEQEVTAMFATIGFPIIISETPGYVYTLLIDKKRMSDKELFLAVSDQLSMFKQRLSIKLQAASLIETSEPFKFWPKVENQLNDLRQVMHSTKLAAMKPAAEILVDRAKHYVRSNLYSFPTLQGAADYLHVHSAYLSKMFKEISGENFSDYTHRLKMEQAVHFLVHTNQRIIQIADQLGYSDSSYFIKVFKKYFNKTPYEFRNR